MSLLRRNQRNNINSKMNSEVSRINLVSSLVEEFKNQNGITDNADIILLDQENDLLRYIEKRKEIRDCFETRQELKNTINSILTF